MINRVKTIDDRLGDKLSMVNVGATTGRPRGKMLLYYCYFRRIRYCGTVGASPHPTFGAVHIGLLNDHLQQ